jgi:hypothetical protein
MNKWSGTLNPRQAFNSTFAAQKTERSSRLCRVVLGFVADHWQRKFFLTLVIADEAATNISGFDQDLYIARIKGSRSCCKDCP